MLPKTTMILALKIFAPHLLRQRKSSC